MVVFVLERGADCPVVLVRERATAAVVRRVAVHVTVSVVIAQLELLLHNALRNNRGLQNMTQLRYRNSTFDSSASECRGGATESEEGGFQHAQTVTQTNAMTKSKKTNTKLTICSAKIPATLSSSELRKPLQNANKHISDVM